MRFIFNRLRAGLFGLGIAVFAWALPMSASADAQATIWMDQCLQYTEGFVADVPLSDPEFFAASKNMDRSCVWTPFEICRFAQERDQCLASVLDAQAGHSADLLGSFPSEATGQGEEIESLNARLSAAFEWDCDQLSFAARLSFAPFSFVQICALNKTAKSFEHALETRRLLQQVAQ
ncbi:MAG: hypothetical protein AAGD04_14850 [Pseudomonadota bacterium]